MMNQCGCGGFIPAQSTVCPNCKQRSVLRRVMVIAGGALASMTLAACYGVPCATDRMTGRCIDPCDETLEDGGSARIDPAFCGVPNTDAGHDAGVDAGVDGGVDGGP